MLSPYTLNAVKLYKMKKLYSIFIIGFLIIVSCSNEQDNSEKSLLKKNTGDDFPYMFETKEVQKAICLHGDTIMYQRVKQLYRDYHIEREVFFYSFIMANRYHYVPAYYDVYMCLWQAFNGGKKAKLWDMTRFDPKSREMALRYLKMGAKRGNKDALRILIKYYTEPVEYGQETKPLNDN
jgi:hypothetical protein